MTLLCPSCGYDIEVDSPIARDGLYFDPRGDVLWHGRSTHLTAAQRALLWALFKAGGRLVDGPALANRIGSDGEDPRAVIAVHMSRLRAKLPGIPIETVYGRGFRWAPGEGVDAAA